MRLISTEARRQVTWGYLGGVEVANISRLACILAGGFFLFQSRELTPVEDMAYAIGLKCWPRTQRVAFGYMGRFQKRA